MSEDTTTDTADQLGEGGIKALKAERDARAEAEKRATALEAEFARFKAGHEQQQSAWQSQLDEAKAATADLEKSLTDARSESTRFRVGVAKGLPSDLIDLLKGDDEAALEEHADVLAKYAPSGNTSIKPDPSQGARGTAGSQSVADQFAAAVKTQL